MSAGFGMSYGLSRQGGTPVPLIDESEDGRRIVSRKR